MLQRTARPTGVVGGGGRLQIGHGVAARNASTIAASGFRLGVVGGIGTARFTVEYKRKSYTTN